MCDEDLIGLKLSLQRALLGEVSGNLHAVTAGFKNGRIVIMAYFYDDVSEDDIEAVQFICTEVAADFLDTYLVEEAWRSVKRDELGELQWETLDFWAFMRKF